MNIRNAPLRSKLRFVILTTCAVALLVACGALFTVQFFFFRKEFHADVKAVAEMLATRLPSSIDFDNPDRATEILQSLAVKPHFTGALLLLNDGRKFAGYQAVDANIPAKQPAKAVMTHMESDILYEQPVEYKGERLGTLYLVADYGTQAKKLISLYFAIFCGVIALSAFIVLLISGKLARLVTGPLDRLASTVKRIAGSNDYSVRAQKIADDEVGGFTDSFNRMIERIEDRDAELRREIIERERAEKELQNLHAQLLDASRQAGMAEVATGVLHNVGNVLNSVNVSATLVAEKLGLHRLNNLVRTAEMLRDKGEELADFFTKDPKGRLIPGYIADLSKHLVAERQEALVELELLTKNIEHIKEIVSMQQNYARLAGFVERLQPESLVEDALRMTTGSLHRHHIEVVRDFSKCPLVSVERHKALQILVNLIRNAKHAMDDASPPSKLLTLRVGQDVPEFVTITIEDNGVGIPPENLTKIFSHGFTTRKNGHGFGLHSAALAAQQMGGKLTGYSKGEGHGATFVFELPIVVVENKEATA